MKKILIVGASGTGKSTLAKRIAKTLDIPRQDLDELYWQPGWRMTPAGEFRDNVKKILDQNSWVIEGVQDEVREDILNKADTLVWVDPPKLTHLKQLITRTVNNVFSKEPCCNGNTESVRRLFSKNSVFLWALRTHRQIKSELTPVFNEAGRENGGVEQAPYSNIKNFVHLRSCKEMDQFIDGLSSAPHKPKGHDQAL